VKANRIKFAGVALAVLAASGCGEVARSGRSPVMPVILSLEGASGATPEELGSPLYSDVVTIVQRTVGGNQVDSPTIFADTGRATFRLVLKDPGVPGADASPSALNSVTFTRYRVVYRRADGRNTPGVDVPYPIDGASTGTIEGSETGGVAFELVRHVAKLEAPLFALRDSAVTISTIADVTFYGRDAAGNEVSVTGQIGVNFGNFGDPQ
jgi:hypothetical protein